MFRHFILRKPQNESINVIAERKFDFILIQSLCHLVSKRYENSKNKNQQKKCNSID